MDLRTIGARAGFYFQSVGQIRAATPWEDQGHSADPRFVDYDWDDHDMDDGSWPDFRLRRESVLHSQPTAPLPDSMLRLIDEFGVGDPRPRELWLPMAVRPGGYE